jgi:uncharacterized protein (DUF3820 family)
MKAKNSEPYTDDTIMPFGAKKGTRLGDISDGYFLTLYDAGKLSGKMKIYVENRIAVLRHRSEKK